MVDGYGREIPALAPARRTVHRVILAVWWWMFAGAVILALAGAVLGLAGRASRSQVQNLNPPWMCPFRCSCLWVNGQLASSRCFEYGDLDVPGSL